VNYRIRQNVHDLIFPHPIPIASLLLNQLILIASESPVYPPPVAYLVDKINSFYIIFSIASFIITWIATAVLLRQYSVKLGKVRYWIVVSLPLLYFLFQFVAFILNAYLPFLSGNTIFYNILITLILTFSKPVGGGIQSSLTEDETKQYSEQVIREVKKQKTASGTKNSSNHDT